MNNKSIRFFLLILLCGNASMPVRAGWREAIFPVSPLSNEIMWDALRDSITQSVTHAALGALQSVASQRALLALGIGSIAVIGSRYVNVYRAIRQVPVEGSVSRRELGDAIPVAPNLPEGHPEEVRQAGLEEHIQMLTEQMANHTLLAACQDRRAAVAAIESHVQALQRLGCQQEHQILQVLTAYRDQRFPLPPQQSFLVQHSNLIIRQVGDGSFFQECTNRRQAKEKFTQTRDQLQGPTNQQEVDLAVAAIRAMETALNAQFPKPAISSVASRVTGVLDGARDRAIETREKLKDILQGLTRRRITQGTL